MFKYYIYRLGQFIVTRLPSKISYKVGVFLSDLHYFFSFRDKRAVRNNLRAFLGEVKNIDFKVKEVFRNFGRYLVEYFRMQKSVDTEYIKKNVKTKNIKFLDEVLKNGKGAIVLSAHIGNWELGGVALGILNYPVYEIALPHKERPVNDLFNHQREAKGVKVIPANIAVRKGFEALKNNNVIAWLGDRTFSNHGEVVDFLNKKTVIPKGPAVFSFKTGAPIIPAFLIRESADTYTFTFYEPIYPPAQKHEEIDKQEVLKIVKKYAKIIENQIKNAPTQWLMFRKYWVEQ